MPKRMLAAAAALGVLLGARWGHAVQVGDVLSNVALKDARGEPCQIPDFGKKLLFMLYADMQAADANDPLADALTAKKFDESVQRGVGVANLADSWAPDFLIRIMIRRKIEKYKSTILTDDDNVLAKAWGLGSCDDQNVVLIIDATGKVLYMKKGVVDAAEIPKVVELVENEVNKALAAAKAASSPAQPPKPTPPR